MSNKYILAVTATAITTAFYLLFRQKSHGTREHSGIKLVEDKVEELHDILILLQDKINILEYNLSLTKNEKSELYLSNIALDNKLKSYITYNYEVLN
jgi:hypothetical protein